MAEPGSGGATEPITLTDPDGAVTRVAPWSSWTREQVRAPGGEPALVTRLDQGQLWFAAGRRRSPWHHEVHVGPAVVSTPRGRFHATAEPDGGATIACLAGRTRVVAGLREPVLLGPEQTAAVSSDGRTLVVMERPDVDAEGADQNLVLAAADDLPGDDPVELLPESAGGPGPGPVLASVPAGAGPPVDPPAVGRSRWGWLPEVAVVAALIAVLLAAIVVFGKPTKRHQEEAGPRARTTVSTSVSTTAVPATTARPVTTTTAPATTTSKPPVTTTTRPRAVASNALAVGELVSCRRADGGVTGSVRVSQKSGPASRFKVTVGLIDAGGGVFAQGATSSAVLADGAVAVVDVKVPFRGAATGSCELLGVTPA